MQYKHPEILFALLLLIIPIIIHLFQLQRFSKTAFTNVKFLKKIALETRKSSRLKKWLILASRLLLFSAIIFAFSQPYLSNKNLGQKTHTILYVDNSLSLSYKINQQEILKKSVQEIINNFPSSDYFTLITNDQIIEKINGESLRKELIDITYSIKPTLFSEIFIKINQQLNKETNTLNNIILISDFQINKNIEEVDVTNVNTAISLINIGARVYENAFVDSLYISNINNSEIELTTSIKGKNATNKNIPISLINNSKLVGKTTTLLDNSNESLVTFKIPFQENINGNISLVDENLSFDNDLFFSISKPKIIKVLSIENSPSFLSKIYTQSNFEFQQKSLPEINYDSLQNKDLIILNEIDEIPMALSVGLEQFYKNGGTMVIIPSEELQINTYNSLFSKLKLGTISAYSDQKRDITTINYNHPVFEGVFENEVENFQFPTSKMHLFTSFLLEEKVISFEDQSSFLSKIGHTNGNVYWFSSPLNISVSNFQNSPLVVPVFYNFGIFSLKPTDLYYTIGRKTTIDIDTSLKNNAILSVNSVNKKYIPLQRTFYNKVELFIDHELNMPGFYEITKENIIVKNIAFNYDRTESELVFSDINTIFKDYNNISISNSIQSIFTNLNQQQEMKSLFKWFLALAILFLLLEICILKFFKA